MASETGKNLTWTVQLVRLLSILSLFAAGGAAQSVTPKFLYTHQYQGDCGNTGVNAFTIDALTGGVTAVTGSPYVLAGYYPQAAVADPAGRYLWIVNGASTMCANPSPGHGTVTSYRIDPATGALADAGPPGPPQILAVGSGPRSGVTDPAGKYLYVATDCPDETSQPPCAKSAIWGFSISQTDGTLTALPGNPFLTGMSAPASGNVSIAIDGSGQHAYATGNLGVAVFLIDPTTGSLSATGSLYPGPPDAANDLSAQTDPSGRFLVSVVSCNDCSSLADWSIGANGGLTNPITLPISLSPSYTAISPTGPFVYVDANDTGGKGVFEGWKLDTVSGGLSSIDVGSVATFPGGSYSFTSPIADPSGKFLFVTDVTYLNGCSTDQGSIFTFAIDAGSGALTPTPGSPRIFSLDGFSNGAVSSGQIHSGTFSLAGLSVSPSSVSLPAGQNTQLTAVGSLSDGTVEYLTSSSIWSSSNPAVAMVSNAGVLFAGSPGTTEIAACFNSVCGSAPLTVTAGTAPPASISPDSVSFGTGGTQSLILTNNSAASLPVIAIRFSGADAGDFTETDTCGGALGASSSCSITVSFAPSAPGMRHAELDVFDSCNGILAISTLIGGATLDSIAVTPVSSTIPAGQTLQFTATGTYSDSSTQTITSSVTWSSSSIAIATIDAAGLATGVKVGGPVDIQAALAGISSNKALLTITAPTLVSISVTPMSTVVAVGKTAQFSATETFSDGSQQNITSSVMWSSSGTAIATIAAGGLATGVKPGSVTITAVLGGASASATLRVLASGLVLTWGPDQYGQLGNGTIAPYSDLPVAVSSIQNAIAVATGGLFSLAVIADGTVKSWGFNNFGQLGNGGVINSSVPQPVANLTGVIDVKAGIEFSLALKSDGTVWAWGSNSNGQLGNGTNTESNVPIQVANLSGVMAIAAGWDFAVALKSDGTVWAWGSGLLGELGNGGNVDSSVPVQVSGLTQTVAISGGQAQAYALKSDGTVWAWGYNGVGQLGNGTNNNSNVPVPVSVLTGVTAISAGNLSSFALRSDGTVWSWGLNDLGELGNGNTVDTNIPAQITGLSGVSAIAAQGESAQALKSDGSLWAWGYGLFGQLGNGTIASSKVPVPVPGLGALLALGTGSSAAHSIVVVSPPVSIGIAPASASIPVGGKQLYTAVATFGNGATLNVTNQVTWSASDPTVATIGQSGLALGLKVGGPVTITATFGRLTSNAASLTVMSAPSGTVVGWGYNLSGQLGNGSNTNSNVAVSASGITGVVAVSGGGFHSLALKSDGTAWAWGLNGFGQLGIGSFAGSSVPVQVSGLADVVAVSAGSYHSLALRSDGTVWAWGYNFSGQLGTGDNVGSPVPIQIPNLTGAIAISAGADYSFAVKSDGTVWAWGANFSGQLGTGSSTDTNVPVQVSGIAGAIAVAAGINYTVALKADGTVWAWGDNSTGELGTGNNTSSNVPVNVSALAGVVSIAAGRDHAQALKPDGSAWRWGFLNLPPSLFESNTVAIAESLGDDIDLKADGTVWVTGFGNTGELGNGSYSYSPVPVQVISLAGALAIGAGPVADHVLAIVSQPVSINVTPASASIQVGGTREFTATATYGNGSTANITNLVTWTASDPANVRIGASGLALGLKPGGPVSILATLGGITPNPASLTVRAAPSGNVAAWGDNFSGQLGNGNTTNSNVPVPVNGLTGVISVEAGEFNSLALKSDGTVWAWGDNADGQLGSGTNSGSDVPIPVPGLNSVLAVGAGFKDSLALKSDGTVWAWGVNSFGQLGTGNTTSSAVPVPVLNLSGVIAISAGDDFNLALKADGTVWAWGENLAGELGNGTTTPSNVPVQVSGLTEVLAISGGFFANHALALRSDGTVWAWGDNTYGELGTGNTISSYSPVQVPNLGGVIAISAGSGFSLALKSDGTVWAWGVNLNGELGNGNNANSATPVPVGGLNGVVAIANEGGAGLALKSDGTVWTWGTNAEGELGNGNNANSNLPVQVTGLAGVVAISRGSNALHELAIVPPPMVSLTTAVSPAGAGSISPPTGTYAAGSNVLVTATANPGYLFTGFSGALSGSANPQTLALNSNSTVVANFAPLQPSMTASVGVRTDGPSAGSRNVPLSLLNSGRGAAGNATITSISAITVLGGSGTVTVLSGTPADIGTIAPANSATATVLFSWPTTATRVRFTVNFTADGGYSGSTIITSFR